MTEMRQNMLRTNKQNELKTLCGELEENATKAKWRGLQCIRNRFHFELRPITMMRPARKLNRREWIVQRRRECRAYM